MNLVKANLRKLKVYFFQAVIMERKQLHFNAYGFRMMPRCSHTLEAMKLGVEIIENYELLRNILGCFFCLFLSRMNTAPPAGSALSTPAGGCGPTTPKKGPPKFKQRQTRTFKSKAPKPGQKGSVSHTYTHYCTVIIMVCN